MASGQHPWDWLLCAAGPDRPTERIWSRRSGKLGHTGICGPRNPIPGVLSVSCSWRGKWHLIGPVSTGSVPIWLSISCDSSSQSVFGFVSDVAPILCRWIMARGLLLYFLDEENLPVPEVSRLLIPFSLCISVNCQSTNLIQIHRFNCSTAVRLKG